MLEIHVDFDVLPFRDVYLESALRWEKFIEIDIGIFDVDVKHEVILSESPVDIGRVDREIDRAVLHPNQECQLLPILFLVVRQHAPDMELCRNGIVIRIPSTIEEHSTCILHHIIRCDEPFSSDIAHDRLDLLNVFQSCDPIDLKVHPHHH